MADTVLDNASKAVYDREPKRMSISGVQKSSPVRMVEQRNIVQAIYYLMKVRCLLITRIHFFMDDDRLPSWVIYLGSRAGE